MAWPKKVPRKSTGRRSDRFHGLASIIANINGNPHNSCKDRRQLRWNAKFEFIEMNLRYFTFIKATNCYEELLKLDPVRMIPELREQWTRCCIQVETFIDSMKMSLRDLALANTYEINRVLNLKLRSNRQFAAWYVHVEWKVSPGQPVQQSWVPYLCWKIGSALQDFIVEAKERDPFHWLHQVHNVGNTLQVESDEEYGSDDEDIPSASRGVSIPIRTCWSMPRRRGWTRTTRGRRNWKLNKLNFRANFETISKEKS